MKKDEVQNFKKSINESGFLESEIALLWEFYVTKSVAKSAGQRRTREDYGIKSLPWTEMKKKAGLEDDKIKILPADSINQTLKDLDLEILSYISTQNGGKKQNGNKAIDIETPRIACSVGYSIADEEKPKAKIGEAECVLTHVRNSFAHGLTYFFNNGFVLLEDKNQNTITARIILRKQTLIDWIYLVDKNEKFYKR